jgi:5-methylcytosine-specific restriction endonuclease McrA
VNYPWENCANPGCDKTFLKVLHNQKYCSNECRRTFYWQRWKARATPEDKLLRRGVHREWKLQHPVSIGKSRYDRRMRLRESHGQHTRAEWLLRVDELGWKCFYCLKPLHVETLTKDHFIPLAQGGSDSIENLVPACLACNLSKNDRMPDALETGRFRESNKTSSNTRCVGNPYGMTDLAAQVMRNEKLRAKRGCVKPSAKHEVLPSKSGVEVIEPTDLSLTYPNLSRQAHTELTQFPRTYSQEGE